MQTDCHILRRSDDRTALLGAAVLAALVVFAVATPFFTPDPQAQSVQVLQGPSATHWLGTNDVGQDVLARLASATRTSLAIAFGAATLATLLSLATGLGAALGPSWLDRLLMRTVDVFLVLPTLVVLILIAAFLPPTRTTTAVLIALFGWAGGARIVRAQALALKQQTHVTAARTFGAGWPRIARSHLIPELSPILVVGFVRRARMAVLLEAGLAFIGISPPDTPSWGAMLRHALAFTYLPAWKWWLLPPGILLSVLMLALVLTGQTLESHLDPRTRTTDRF